MSAERDVYHQKQNTTYKEKLVDELNEEIKYHVYIDEPQIAQPLCEAQNLGYDYQPILTNNSDIEEIVYISILIVATGAGIPLT